MSTDIKTVERKSNIKNGVSRLIFSALAILSQILWVLLLVQQFNQYAEWVSLVAGIFALILVIAIYSQDKTSSLKVPWIILIMALPPLGIVLYLLIGISGSTRKMRRRYQAVDERLFPLLEQQEETVRALQEKNKNAEGISRYLRDYGSFPVCQNTEVIFYPEAAQGFQAQKEALEKAQKFIFMEYHAIEDAQAWQELQEILERKVKAGVEVRLFYDDMGSIWFINKDFVKRMERVGIQCRVFNPMSPVFQLFLNNRDHRKITVIDGQVGFTGGYNLANEYFGLTAPYGKWKDTGIRMEGEAVKTLTVLFLEMWNAVVGKGKNDQDFAQYLTDAQPKPEAKGFVQPYGDNPMGHEHIGENVYISIVENAKDYCYFTTPYLIITDEMNHAMGLAAKRGVDVRIITPGIPDKKMIYQVTRSYYAGLVKNGVRIFEYTPGFCHAKQCVSDDRMATCGTINLDYRSLYHHFENGCLLVDCDAVLDIKQDFEETFAQCREVTENYRSGRAAVPRGVQLILRLFAALL